jgi:transcriptional regulator with XRE-family HTH domain
MSLRDLPDLGKKILGANLAAARERAGFKTALAAARKTGIARPRLSLWENGHAAPMADGLLRLAIAYGCPLDDFFGGVDERYDEIIERRVDVNAQQLYRAKTERLKALTVAAIDLTNEAVETRAPKTATPRGTSRTGRGKSKSTRARRKPKP